MPNTHPQKKYKDKDEETSSQQAKPVGHKGITCTLGKHADWPGTKGHLVTLALEAKGDHPYNQWRQLAAIDVDGVMQSNGDDFADPSFSTELPDWATHYRTVLNVERGSTHKVDTETV
jgi:hypothetical protein